MSGVGRDVMGEVSDVEKEERILKRWAAKAKGKPIRWRMIRDLVAIVKLSWMSTSQVQIAMRRLWALKNKTTRDLLEELEQERAIAQEKAPGGGFKWGTTKEGAAFWIGHVSNIPARIAAVVSTTMLVDLLEE